MSTDDNERCTLGCKHSFHRRCIVEALLHRQVCPLCRREATTEPVAATTDASLPEAFHTAVECIGEPSDVRRVRDQGNDESADRYMAFLRDLLNSGAADGLIRYFFSQSVRRSRADAQPMDSAAIERALVDALDPSSIGPLMSAMKRSRARLLDGDLDHFAAPPPPPPPPPSATVPQSS